MSRKCRGVDLPDLETGVLVPDMVEDAGREGGHSGGLATDTYIGATSEGTANDIDRSQEEVSPGGWGAVLNL